MALSMFVGLLVLCLVSMVAGNCYLSAQNYVCAETVTLGTPKTTGQKAVVKLSWTGTMSSNDTISVSWGSRKLNLSPVYGATDYLITDYYTAGSNSFHYELTSSTSSSSITISTSYVWSYY